jgi:predicted PurR-regulated permease PerM
MNARPQSKWILQVALTAIALYLCWTILKPFLSVLLWASVLTLVFYPAHAWWLRRLGRPSLAAFVSTMLVITTIIVPVVLVSSAVIRQLQGVATTAQGQVTAMIADPAQTERLQELFALAYEYLGVEEAQVREGLQQAATNASQFLVQGTVNVLGGALGFVLSTFFVMFTMYYLFKDGPRAAEAMRDLLPVGQERGNRLVARTADIISASVYGVVVIAIVQGTLGGLMFWVLGLPSPLVWGVVMVVFATIPMLGTFVVWVPAAIFLAVSGHVVKAVVLTVWGALVIGMVDNFLRPRLVGQRAQMHELLIFFSVLGGLQVFGVLGILLGPVVVALALGMLEAFRADDDVVLVVAADAPVAAPAHTAPAVTGEPPAQA